MDFKNLVEKSGGKRDTIDCTKVMRTRYIYEFFRWRFKSFLDLNSILEKFLHKMSKLLQNVKQNRVQKR